jgi:hypothetical protein
MAQNSYVWQKLIRPMVREIANLRKADKSMLFQILLAYNALVQELKNLPMSG